MANIIGLVVVFLASALSIMHYGFVQGYSVYKSDLQASWNLDEDQARRVYMAMNLGATVLSFLPGCVFDKYGTITTSAVGCVMTIGGLVIPIFFTSYHIVYFGFFMFGLGAGFFNFNSVLSVLKVFPQRWAGLGSAGILVCLALGNTMQSQIYFHYFKGNFMSFLTYMCSYSLASAVFPVLATLGVEATPPSIVEVERHESAASFGFEQPEAGGSFASRESATRVGSVISGPVEMSRLGNSYCAESSEPISKSFAELMCSSSFFFLVCVFGHCIALSFALMGDLDTMGRKVGFSEEEIAKFVSMSGIGAAVGKLLLATPSDACELLSPAFGKDFFYLVSHIMFTAGLALMAWSMETHLWIGAFMVFVGYGGALGLGPGKIRVAFGSEYIGLMYGLLYEVTALTFVGWSEYTPGENQDPEAFFKYLFIAFVLSAFCTLFAGKLWLQTVFASKPRAAARDLNLSARLART
eukprot:TRINITY_DN15978_c0_g1_i1.p1 TRINITY_DN15978_c0_g1~~TRINITY_DN15978_c0_g1_i1.p1  ORF type:complete len:483 (+),score=61.83 TRINITY_DN15978_c0_g1_i1:48-1451(+)